MSEFLDFTPREFANAITGYVEEQEQASREQWEQARLIAYYSFIPYSKKKGSVTSIIPLPWDTQASNQYADFPVKPTNEQIQFLMQRLDKTLN